MRDLNKRLTEVEQVIKQLAQDERKKIPEEIYRYIEDNKDENYDFKYDVTLPLEEQRLHRDTIKILSYININFLLNSEQSAFLEEMHRQNEKKNGLAEQQIGVENVALDSLDVKYTHQHNDDIKDKAMIAQEKNIFKKILQKLKLFLINLKNK